jgi:MoxR-like ATPase
MDAVNVSTNELLNYAAYEKLPAKVVYDISPDLNDAIQMALLLNQPLLLTGEPGTGKTSVARKVAADLHGITNGGFREEPYEFQVKSNSVFSDLFYTYDAISHFYDANINRAENNSGIPNSANNTTNKRPDLKDYIELNALGLAIAASMDPVKRNLIPARNVPADSYANSVVLIDEIDKAPRDFPNDLLFELEQYSFKIKEKGMDVFSKGESSNILIILTSNGERDLPEAFLRRCIYFKIDFPDRKRLETIISKHNLLSQFNGRHTLVLDRFAQLREICKNKKPATAELLSWCRVLLQNKTNLNDTNALIKTLYAVVKDPEDLKRVRESWAAETTTNQSVSA